MANAATVVVAKGRGRDGGRRLVPVLGRLALLPVVVAVLWGLWEGYKWLWETTGWTEPFVVDDRTLPHLHTVVSTLFDPTHEDGPLLLTVLLEAAAFTAREAIVGFALGASLGFLLGAAIARSRVLQRGMMPYVVASQTVPILAIGPIVVIGLGSRGVEDWVSVSVIAAYLTFFPVTINTVRGLHSADPRALELMHSYAAGEWSTLRRLLVPSALPYLFAAFKVSATASIVGAIVGEFSSSIQEGLGGAILVYSQEYTFRPQFLWATNIVAALLGIAFFVAVAVAEKLVVRRAPEQLA